MQGHDALEKLELHVGFSEYSVRIWIRISVGLGGQVMVMAIVMVMARVVSTVRTVR